MIAHEVMSDGSNSSANRKSKASAGKRQNRLSQQFANAIYRAVKVPRSAPDFRLKAYARLASMVVLVYPKVKPDVEVMRRELEKRKRMDQFGPWETLKIAHQTVMAVFGEGETFAERLHYLTVMAHGQREREDENGNVDLYELADKLTSVDAEEKHRLNMRRTDLENAATYCGESSFSAIIEHALKMNDQDADWKNGLTDPSVDLETMIEHIRSETFYPPGYD